MSSNSVFPVSERIKRRSPPTGSKKIQFFEEFSPRSWSYVGKDEDESKITEDDDMYSEKGKRKKLPIEIKVIFKKSKPSICGLVGVFKASVVKKA